MPITLQVCYPATDGTTFDHDYYLATHLPLVQDHIGAELTGATASRGLSGGADAPPPFHAIATLTFPDRAAFDSAMAKMGPVVEDIAKFTDCQPQLLVGEVVA